MAEAKTPVRGAVIGYGGAFNMGRQHLQWMQAAGIQPVAACDTDAARMDAAQGDFPGIRTYTDYQELLKDTGVDLCVVILPHNLHAPVAIACAEAGKHVIVEKPMCITVREADAMIAAAKGQGVMLSIFHNRRHDGDFLAIKEVLEKGLIGEVFHIEANIGGYGRPGTWWRSDKTISGGAMYDWGAHFLDWILQMVPGEVQGVNGYFQKRMWHEATNEDHTQAIIRFANGCVADLQVSSLNAAPKPRWRILGTKGGIIDEWKDPFTLNVDHEGYIATVKVPYKKTYWQAYYDDIAAHLTDGAELDVKPEEGRRIIAILEAAERSALTGETVRPDYV
jgi:scyllo-inositol 2-dehydrogenase (NADP+)